MLHVFHQQQVQYDITQLDADELDISNASAVQQFFEKNNPFDIIINCAAYTAVDKAEAEASQAFAVNYQGPQHLVQFMPASCIFIHISNLFIEILGKRTSNNMWLESSHSDASKPVVCK